MAEVATARPKRARSPSPSYADALASPLEVLLKRRRRTTWSAVTSGPPTWEEEVDSRPNSSSNHETSSPLARASVPDYNDEDSCGAVGVERRRARQWERLQAPQSSSQPVTLPVLHDSSPLRYSRERAMSQPEAAEQHMGFAVPAIQHMSSSPVRHQDPSSTPFRADDEWAPEERLRAWGDEYASQNSLLYSLHMARAENTHHYDPNSTPYSSRSVHMGSTPASSAHFLHPNRTPTLPNRYRHAQRTPLDTPDLASSPSSSVSAFSPFPHAPHASPVAYEQENIRASYEEANRLLAELNMQRLRRHSHDEAGMDESP